MMPLIVVAGPTASGKTALALRLAKAFNGEIISCDSVAVYRLMEIGTAKPSVEEREQVKHHCLDLYWPNEVCTAGDYARHARAAISDVCQRGKLPILAGGTGLYQRATIEGLAPAPPRDETLRSRLRNIADKRGSASLHRILRRLDPAAAGLIHANDVPKLIRSIEVTLSAQSPQTTQWQAGREALTGYSVLQFGLTPERSLLYRSINERAAAMFSRGLVAETSMLRSRFGSECRALGALGYAQAMQVLQSSMTVEAAITATQQGHRNYAKRQITWFRRDPQMHWLVGFGGNEPIQEQALSLTREHLFRCTAVEPPPPTF